MIERTNYAHEKPILFSGPMIRAILDGKKTMTRRIIKPQPTKEWHKGIGVTENRNGELCLSNSHGIFVSDLKCPYCQKIGDHLWVRETFNTAIAHEDHYEPTPKIERGRTVLHKATDSDVSGVAGCEEPGGWFWRPCIHMPRWASRIDLEITAIAVEQLHAITEEDARAEGVGSVEEFKDLWKMINGPESWDSNPWVWVVKFEVSNIRR